MNTFGIDYQQSLTVIALREEYEGRSVIRSVGDGSRSLIPNAVSLRGEWGSRAGKQPDVFAAGVLEPTGDGAWLDDPGPGLFWHGLYSRLRSYLGRLDPLRRNGYRSVVALQGANWEADAHAVGALARAAGFEEIVVIPSTHALLCRWLSTTHSSLAEVPCVVAVAVGETSTQVCGFRIEWSRPGTATIAAASIPSTLPRTGQAYWNQRLFTLLKERLSEDLLAGHDRALRDAAMRYAIRLSRTEAGQSAEWREVFEDRLYQPLLLSLDRCQSWPEASNLAAQMPNAVRAALRTISSPRPDVLVVGGVGTVWPFAEVIATGMGICPVWRSGAPEDDVAAGATRWGELCQHPSGVLLDRSVSLGQAPTPSRDPLRSLPTDDAMSIPPWERG